jgi:hypothetical protein
MPKMAGVSTRIKEVAIATLALGKKISVMAMVAKSLPQPFIKVTSSETKKMDSVY